MSIICLSVIGFLTVFQSVKLIGRSDPELNMYEIESNYEYANFRELGFTFAVQSIDKRVGRVAAEYHRWDIAGRLPKTPIQMVNCSSILEGGDPDDVKTGYIHNKVFNPYKSHARL